MNTSLEKVTAKTIAGFANSTGGELLLGVDDARHVVGLDLDYQSLRKPGREGFALQLTQMLTKYLGTTVMAFVRVVLERVGTHHICVVSVAAATQPVFTSDEGNVVIHLRTSNSTRPLLIDEALRFASTRWPPAPSPRRVAAQGTQTW